MTTVTMRTAYRDVSTVTVTVCGDLDISCADRLQGILDAVVLSHRADIILDFREVPFIDACAVRTLVALDELATQRGGQLTIVGAVRPVLKVLRITGIAFLCELARSPLPQGGRRYLEDSRRADESLDVPVTRADHERSVVVASAT